MNRLISLLLLVLILAVCGLGLLLVRADEQARADRDEMACLQRVATTATVALLAPSSRVDTEGRVEAMSELGGRLDRC